MKSGKEKPEEEKGERCRKSVTISAGVYERGKCPLSPFFSHPPPVSLLSSVLHPFSSSNFSLFFRVGKKTFSFFPLNLL